MDAKDVRIFCEMAFKYPDYNKFAERRISPTEIGRKLGLDKKTVQLRIKKMEDEGFIKYYQAMPNLSLLGTRSVGMYTFEAPDVPSKYQALDHLRRAPWVVELLDFLGPIFMATLAAQSPEDAQKIADEITSRFGLKGGSKTMDRATIEPNLQFYKLDWQILQNLRYNALCPAKEIADALSITPRMAEYRISKLLESRAFFILAMINHQKREGIFFYLLTLSVDEAKRQFLDRELREMCGEKLWLLRSMGPGIIRVNLFAFAIGEPEEVLMKSLKFPGVKQGFLLISKEHIEPERPSWIDGLIQRKILEQVPS
jgi:DNA-binding Lrp family transcriptional regulator